MEVFLINSNKRSTNAFAVVLAGRGVGAFPRFSLSSFWIEPLMEQKSMAGGVLLCFVLFRLVSLHGMSANPRL